MRIVIQRVSAASVRVDREVVGQVGPGLCLLVGVQEGDGAAEVDAAMEKILGLRVFADEEGRMNLSLIDVGGQVLVVSQFTLLGELKKGRRPSFTNAAAPEAAAPLIDRMVAGFRDRGVVTAQGVFGALMEVELVNDGPVTLVLEAKDGTILS